MNAQGHRHDAFSIKRPIFLQRLRACKMGRSAQTENRATRGGECSVKTRDFSAKFVTVCCKDVDWQPTVRILVQLGSCSPHAMRTSTSRFPPNAYPDQGDAHHATTAETETITSMKAIRPIGTLRPTATIRAS